MQIKDSIRSYLENNLDLERKDIILGLINIFNYAKEKAEEIYSAWRKLYRKSNYKTIENQMSAEDREILKRLDEGYINWLRPRKLCYRYGEKLF